MDAAEASETPVLCAVLGTAAAKLSTVLYYILMMLCRGTALDTVVNCGVGEGLEGWRQLCMTHEPKVRSRWAGQLVAILAWSFSGDPISRIEAFEREITQ